MRSIRVALLLAACFGSASPPARAAELAAPRLLADLAPGVSEVPARWPPYLLGSAGERMLFVAELATSSELWSSDGTPQGSERIFAAESNFAIDGWAQAGAVEVLFEGEDAAVFRSDGTAAGTVLVAHWPNAYFGWYAHDGQRTWVGACYDSETSTSCELWMVDGAALTATKVAGGLSIGSNYLHEEQVAAGGRFWFFETSDENEPTRLWRSDGTAASTVPLAELPAEGYVYWLGRSGRRVFFAVDLDSGGDQLWSSDGTPAGTRMVVQLASYPDPPGWMIADRDGGPFFFVVHEAATHTTGLWAVGPAGKARRLGSFGQMEGAVYATGAGAAARYLFAARRQATPAEQPRLHLWVTDGTPGGTTELRDGRGRPIVVERTLGVAAGRLWFAGVDEDGGSEPWTSDGTAAGTHRVADLCPGPCGTPLAGVTAVGGATLFATRASAGGQTLWRSDSASASPVASLPGEASFDTLPELAVAGGRTFFTLTGADGFALWASDGTAAGTGPADAGFTAPLGSAAMPLAVSAQSLVFAAADPLDPDRQRLFLQHGDEALPAGVPLPAYVHPTAAVLDDERHLALFVSGDDDGSDLWSTDGTPGGTIQLGASGAAALAGDKYYDECYDTVALPRRFGDHWVFAAYVCGEGDQLWSTDGSLEGTRRLSLLPEEAELPVVVGDGVFFLAPDESAGGAAEKQLYRVALGGGAPLQLTHRAGGVPTSYRYWPVWPAAASGRIFFTVAVVDGGTELWVSDGTVAGTGAIVDGASGSALAGVVQVAATADLAIAWTRRDDATGSVFGIALTTRLATRLADMFVNAPYYGGMEWAAAGAGIVFTGNDPQRGYEPWITDGTVAGTRVLDLVPGPGSSNPHAFAASDAGTFFAARTFETGEELWLTDGGDAGARLAADIAPGRASSAPDRIVAGPGRLLFVADDGASGREPWLLEWTPAGAAGAAEGGVR
ncbi:MAG TPA: hypothetical protein VGS57_07240 [Thermoanaerobaculia bacterium]|jgi:ELWxxDGT repeat protein|nr:hypothetical protein [Thermoanaerobaculia bacterium]